MEVILGEHRFGDSTLLEHLHEKVVHEPASFDADVTEWARTGANSAHAGTLPAAHERERVRAGRQAIDQPPSMVRRRR